MKLSVEVLSAQKLNQNGKPYQEIEIKYPGEKYPTCTLMYLGNSSQVQPGQYFVDLTKHLKPDVKNFQRPSIAVMPSTLESAPASAARKTA